MLSDCRPCFSSILCSPTMVTIRNFRLLFRLRYLLPSFPPCSGYFSRMPRRERTVVWLHKVVLPWPLLKSLPLLLLSFFIVLSLFSTTPSGSGIRSEINLLLALSSHRTRQFLAFLLTFTNQDEFSSFYKLHDRAVSLPDGTQRFRCRSTFLCSEASKPIFWN